MPDPANTISLRPHLVRKLQHLNIQWRHVPGKENVFDDVVSRANWPDYIAMVHGVYGPPGDDDDDGGTDSSDDADDDEHDLRQAAAVTRAAAAPAPAPVDDAATASDSTVEDPFEYRDTTQVPRTPEFVQQPADASDELLSSDKPALASVPAAAPADAVRAPSPTPPTDGAWLAAAASMADAIARVPQLTSDADAERLAWAAEQAADRNLHRFFDAAYGIRTPVTAVTQRRPTVDGFNRLFVQFGPARATLLVVPQSRVTPLVIAMHDALAHRSAALVQKALLATHWWPGMPADIERIISECMLCQAYLRAPRATAPGSSFPPTRRFGAVHLDYVELPATRASPSGPLFSGVLLAVDRTTGAARAEPVPNKTTAALSAAFEQSWISIFGAPESVTSDGALETKSRAWLTFCNVTVDSFQHTVVCCARRTPGCSSARPH